MRRAPLHDWLEGLPRLTTSRMHADELDTDEALVRRLLARQFPEWAQRPVARVPSAGTDNAIYRLGDDLALRLPRHAAAVGQVELERRWLPRLAPELPFAIPVPIAEGLPGEGYPWPWSVYRWLDGDNPTPDRVTDMNPLARDLAQWIAALRRIDPAGGPPSGSGNSFRGVALSERDAPARAGLAALRGVVDTHAATQAWEAALAAPVWKAAPVWVHGDLHAGNLLVDRGRLSAVIDFGCLGVGDPACDLMVAWNLFDAEARAAFRSAVAVDAATWARGRGWALYFGLVALPYYQHTNPGLARIARQSIASVLSEPGA